MARKYGLRQPVTNTSSATASTTYECVNGGGKHPQASNKFTSVTHPTESGQFTADQNGNIEGDLTLSPPTAEDLNFSCPPGQDVTFVGVTEEGPASAGPFSRSRQRHL
jgi:hypothetical protein